MRERENERTKKEKMNFIGVEYIGKGTLIETNYSIVSNSPKFENSPVKNFANPPGTFANPPVIKSPKTHKTQ